MNVAFTIDVEQDCPPYLNTWRGIEEGMPRLLDLLKSENVPATFFCTGEVARRFPKSIEQIVSAGHELGCHGDTHAKFTDISRQEAMNEIRNSKAVLSEYDSVTSFRAPYLKFPQTYTSLLKENDFKLDSSEARYKKYGVRSRTEHGLRRVPASVTSSTLRYPRWIRHRIFSWLSDPAVLFVHPWEFVDFRNSDLRWDCKFRTGDTALDCARDAIQFFKRRKSSFKRMKEL